MGMQKGLQSRDGENMELSQQLRSAQESSQYAEARSAELRDEVTSLKKTLRSEQHSRKHFQSDLEQLRHLANLDVQVLVAESDLKVEELQERETKLKQAKEETVRAMQELDNDYTAKFNTQRGKLQEFRERARKVMDDKDREIKSLLDKTKELQEQISSGRPMEKKIFDIAERQASNDRLRVHAEAEAAKMEHQLKEKDERLAKFRQGEASLKAQIRDLQSKSHRGEVDMEYVKNVVVKYMGMHHNSIGQEQLVPLIANLLEFTPDDIRAVREAHEQQ